MREKCPKTDYAYYHLATNYVFWGTYKLYFGVSTVAIITNLALALFRFRVQPTADVHVNGAVCFAHLLSCLHNILAGECLTPL